MAVVWRDEWPRLVLLILGIQVDSRHEPQASLRYSIFRLLEAVRSQRTVRMLEDCDEEVCTVGLSIISVYFMTPTELRQIVRWESRTSSEFTHSSFIARVIFQIRQSYFLVAFEPCGPIGLSIIKSRNTVGLRVESWLMEACSYMPDFKETAIALQFYPELVSHHGHSLIRPPEIVK
ncbi:hypothetical protein BC629DRAFT_1725643 [Irpex lacteus]|nr:hypothetical protein BC629DRAFT_1725643 [Irpex lacteus]